MSIIHTDKNVMINNGNNQRRMNDKEDEGKKKKERVRRIRNRSRRKRGRTIENQHVDIEGRAAKTKIGK